MKDPKFEFLKDKSKLIRIDDDKTILCKKLVCSHSCQGNKQLFNISCIDETLFSRVTKSAYLWSEKGKEWAISNI